ncbi:breast carcinoma-amplified sequence 4 [Phalacrocorax carbo]|uniref:breast carcinoma-amplified sequence 4 n=1 Tax=Phalacrocorax carbo TaxID=9209 RepID=UPI00311A2DD7
MLRPEEPPEPRAGAAAAAEESGARRLPRCLPPPPGEEAFVKMVTHHVSFLEEQVLEAGNSHGTFLNTVCKLFQCVTISSFKNGHPLPAAAHFCDLLKLYRRCFSYEL